MYAKRYEIQCSLRNIKHSQNQPEGQTVYFVKSERARNGKWCYTHNMQMARLFVSDVFVSRGWKMGENGKGGREGGCDRKRCINREGEEVCGWTLTALNSFLICHFYILFLPSWRHLMLLPRWHSRVRLRPNQFSTEKKAQHMQCFPNVFNIIFSILMHSRVRCLILT